MYVCIYIYIYIYTQINSTHVQETGDYGGLSKYLDVADFAEEDEEAGAELDAQQVVEREREREINKTYIYIYMYVTIYLYLSLYIYIYIHIIYNYM